MGADEELRQRAQLRVGTTLRGKYHLDAVLGVGGMAFVYRATDENNVEYAIKMLHPELSLRESIRNRFLREGRAASAVKHRGVVSIIDQDVADDGAAFLVMELLRGESLETIMLERGGKVTVPFACAVLDQLLDVLVVAHAAGVVHRDLKPSNLFIGGDGAVKVLDFGIARVRDGLSSESHATATGVLLGTPAFMAPEQARAKSSEIDARTDLWAAAATFFALVSGETVHKGDNSAQLMIAAATSFPRSVRTVATLPEPVARVVDRALSFDRAARFENAAEMRDAFRDSCVEAFGAPPMSRPVVPPADPSGEIAWAPTLASDAATETDKTALEVGTHAPRARKGLPMSFVGAGVLATVVVVAAVVKYSSRHEEPMAVVDSAGHAATSASASSSAPVVGAQSTSTPQPSTTAVSHHPRPTPVKSNCDPPYHFDSSGTKIFHKECF